MAEQLSESSVKITYETLYELLRREKQREDLQKLDPPFFNDVRAYLGEKQAILEQNKLKTDFFSQTEHEKTQLQLVNVKKILKELYDRRERKLCDIAINKSRVMNAVADTTNMLAEEKILFNTAVNVLMEHRETILMSVLSTQAEMPSQKTEPAKPAVQSVTQVKFIDTVDQFVGKELELYGPYTPEQTAELPAEIASILIKQGKAVNA